MGYGGCTGSRTKTDVHGTISLQLLLFVRWCVLWITTDQCVATTAAAAVGAAAAAAVNFTSQQQKEEEKKEGEENRRDKKETQGKGIYGSSTKHGYTNDSIMHRIHITAAHQRHHQPPSGPGRLFGWM